MMITALWPAMQQSSITSLLLIFALLGLLLARELMLAEDITTGTDWGPILDVAIVPLLISFVVIVAVRIAMLV